MLIALPINEDGSKIVVRTGRAPFFGIYKLDLQKSEIEYIEKIENGHSIEELEGVGHHEQHTETEIEHHRKFVRALKKCDYLLALALGPNMRDALLREGVKVKLYKKKDASTPDELLKLFMDNIDKGEQ